MQAFDVVLQNKRGGTMLKTLASLCGGVVVLLAGSAHAEDLTAMMQRCAPNVHPTTLSAIVKTESSGRMYVLLDNGPANLPFSVRKTMLRTIYPESATEAASIARDLISRGHLVDMGLTQLNNRNLAGLGLSVEQALDPCTNLWAGSTILSNFYANASKQYRDQQSALLAAISAYNTGDFERGFNNGYVKTVIRNAGQPVPALLTAGPRVSTGGSSRSGGRVAHRSGLLDAKFSELEVEFR
ncbi:lytic transglycosylase domain-containing protein (plasmid) [Paraburkholderia sprentiae WSM5005]|uniref:Lytic transglycosylase domain-containing protein n=1 Tax=Paraburkholderia sprentiae WSM5005 TaxID=754502 RepID=A0ACA8AXA2_9BURK|nr:lytic transglycosylase domain-containing protein [Paraburkholderia sprentiae]APA90303.2 lytic transglycosylase domain-containing protein [Paraburkholderia sprentiae WSM5005]